MFCHCIHATRIWCIFTQIMPEYKRFDTAGRYKLFLQICDSLACMPHIKGTFQLLSVTEPRLLAYGYTYTYALNIPVYVEGSTQSLACNFPLRALFLSGREGCAHTLTHEYTDVWFVIVWGRWVLFITFTRRGCTVCEELGDFWAKKRSSATFDPTVGFTVVQGYS